MHFLLPLALWGHLWEDAIGSRRISGGWSTLDTKTRWPRVGNKSRGRLSEPFPPAFFPLYNTTTTMTRKPITPDCSDPVLPNERDIPHRSSVKRMRKGGASCKQIQDATGVPLRTQFRIMKQSSQRIGKKRSGRTVKITHDTIGKMIKSLEGQYKHRTWTWEKAWDAHNLACSVLTLKHHMQNAGYHKCHACQKSWISDDQAEKRKVFCTEMLNWPE